MTYGWAVALLLIILTALYSFGVFSPGRFVPQECVFQRGVGCEYYRISKVTNLGYNVTFTVRNGLGFDVRFAYVNFSAEDLGGAGRFTMIGTRDPSLCSAAGSTACCSPQGVPCLAAYGYFTSLPAIVRAGDSATFTIFINSLNVTPQVGTLQRLTATVGYLNCAAAGSNYDPGNPASCSLGNGATAHAVSGRIVASVEPS